jgi:hypothetical protein
MRWLQVRESAIVIEPAHAARPMYIIDQSIKNNAAQRWALPDCVFFFFACGACHILAFAFLERDMMDCGCASRGNSRTTRSRAHAFLARFRAPAAQGIDCGAQ